MQTSDTTHAPITLAPGLDLIVHADFASDPSIGCLIDRIRSFVDRDANLETIRGDVEFLAQHDCVDGLLRVLEATGFLENLTQTSSVRLRAAILALLDVLDLDRLLAVAENSAHAIAHFHGVRETMEELASADEVTEQAA